MYELSDFSEILGRTSDKNDTFSRVRSVAFWVQLVVLGQLYCYLGDTYSLDFAYSTRVRENIKKCWQLNFWLSVSYLGRLGMNGQVYQPFNCQLSLFRDNDKLLPTDSLSCNRTVYHQIIKKGGNTRKSHTSYVSWSSLIWAPPRPIIEPATGGGTNSFSK